MGLYVNPSAALLQEAMNGQIFIDKSLLIAELNKLVCTPHKFLCVSRARRFGKTMAGSMIAAYYSKGANYGLLEFKAGVNISAGKNEK